MLKLVSGISSGIWGATLPNAWLSVTTRCGRRGEEAKKAGISSGCSTMAVQRLSRISRSICTCGRIMRPVGASESMGVTSMTNCPGRSSPPSRERCSRLPMSRMTASSSVWRSPFTVEKGRRGEPHDVRICSCSSAVGRLSSDLLCSTRKGSSHVLHSSSSRSSGSPKQLPLMTRIAASACRRASNVFSTRSFPSSPVSSMPGVSMNTTEAVPGIS